MGDPSFVKNLSWDRGNASNVSVSPFIYLESIAWHHFKKDKRLAFNDWSRHKLTSCPVRLDDREYVMSRMLIDRHNSTSPA